MKLMPSQVQEIVRLLNAAINERRVVQEELAKSIGVDQGQLSRILRAQFTKISPNIRKLCAYFGIDPESAVRRDAFGEQEVLLAFREAWDGSEQHARAMVDVIRACGAFGCIADKNR